MTNTTSTKGTPFQSSTFSPQKVDQLKQVLQGQEEHGPLPPSGSLQGLPELERELDAARLEIETLKDKLVSLEKETKDARLQGLADLENTRRRLQKEKEDLMRYGNETLLHDLLATVDNLERSLAHIEPSPGTLPLIEGVKLVLKGLLTTLGRFGVTEIDTQKQSFDPNFHEAIGQKQVDDLAANTIVDVVQKGYLYRDRLLRPARVIVSQ